MADLDNTSDDGALTIAGMMQFVVSATWTSATALNTVLSLDTHGCGTVAFEFTGIGTLNGGLLTFEASSDNGTTWYLIQGVQAFGGGGLVTNTLALSGLGNVVYLFTFGVSGFTNFRARLSTVITGTGSIFIQMQSFAFPSAHWSIVSQQNANALKVQLSDGSNNSILTSAGALTVSEQSAILAVTATAATGVAVTATLPAVAGQFHYISLIEITKYFTLANVASATPLLVTTTNLPGSLVFTFGQPLGTIGATDERIYTPAAKLRSSVVNTATTIVCPATTGIIWRVNVFYSASV